MKVVPSAISSATSLHTNLPPNFTASALAYNAATTYNQYDFVYAAEADGSIGVFYSLRASNLAHDPGALPLWWSFIAYLQGPWNSGITYGLNGKAYKNNRLYNSLQVANLNNDPETSPTWWQDVGPAIQFAMFDTLRNTPTVFSSPLEVVIAPGQRVDTCAILAMSADTVRIRVVTDASTISYGATIVDFSKLAYGGSGAASVSPSSAVVYDQTITLVAHASTTWFSYFFGPFVQTDATLFEILPQYTGGAIILTFTKANGYISVGNVTVGSAVDLGAIQYGAEDDATNYSSITRDDFGEATLIPRRSVPKTNQTVWAPKASVPSLRSVRDALNAVPAVWSGLDDATDAYFPSLLINGIYRTFTINIAYTDKAVLTLDLEEI